jgi:hypothetical protein
MTKQTISGAIDARLAFLKQAQEERDLQLIIEDLESAGFIGSIATAYTLRNPGGLDIEIEIAKSMRPEHAKPFTLLVEVEKGTELETAYLHFPVCQREEMFDFIIGEINSAGLV